MTSKQMIDKYSLVLTKPCQCQYDHPTHKCDKVSAWEHEGKYYCGRHYYALVKGWDWVKRYEWTNDILKGKEYGS